MFLFSLEHISKTFKNNRTSFTAVNDVTLMLPAKGLVSIVGKSGCGKSTLLNLLIGIEKPSKGKIYFINQSIVRWSKKQLSKYRLRDISMVYQHYNLLDDLPVIENIALPLMIQGRSKKSSFNAAETMLQSFGMERLKTQIVGTLSGGEKQRISIMRALITHPKAILCDEPTGALDEKNSQQIMDELKKISKGKLVLMVSHNMSLVKQYSDRIIEMNDGKIANDKTINLDQTFVENEHQKIRYKHKWAFSLIKQLFKKNVFKGIFSFISLVVGFISLFVGIGFISGSEKSQKEALKRNLATGCATISETSYYSIANSPLEFKKNIRPNTEIVDAYLDSLEYYQILPNTNYFFSAYPSGYFKNNQIKNFEMVPLLNSFIEQNDVYPGIAGDFIGNFLTNVIVNNEFLKEINLSKKEALGSDFSISYETSITLYTNDEEKPFINDQFSYNLKLKIIDIVDEFSFMNSPKIYYSYDALSEFLKSETLTNISQYQGENISVLDYIEKSKDDSPESSYSSFIFLEDISTSEKLYEIINQTSEKKDAIQIESKAYTIGESYKQFISSFKDALVFFLAIGTIGVLFILGMISLSNFLENKKQSAILTCLGAKTNSISLIYLAYNSIITVLSFLVGFTISFALQNILNKIVHLKFGLTGLISIPINSFLGIKFGLVFTTLFGSLFCTFLFTILPIVAYKNFSISGELRDE